MKGSVNNMKRLISFALIICLALPIVAAAGQSNQSNTSSTSSGDWSVVQSVTLGDKLSVKLKDGKKVEGRLRAASDTTLTLDRGNKTSDLDRNSIARIHRYVPNSVGKSIGKSTAIGAGVGFGAGAGLGLAAGQYEDIETAALVGIFGAIGAGVGAAVGAIVGAASATGRKKMLIYEVK
jgi:hypothetical protein